MPVLVAKLAGRQLWRPLRLLLAIVAHTAVVVVARVAALTAVGGEDLVSRQLILTILATQDI